MTRSFLRAAFERGSLVLPFQFLGGGVHGDALTGHNPSASRDCRVRARPFDKF